MSFSTQSSHREIDQAVQDYLASHPDARYVDSDIFTSCYSIIKPWLNFSVLLPYLMKYELANSPDDMKMLTSPYYLPDTRRNHLFDLAQNGGRHGFMILYMCLRESTVECTGHKDATRELEECAMQRNVPPPWNRERPDYRALTTTEGRSTTSTICQDTDDSLSSGRDHPIHVSPTHQEMIEHNQGVGSTNKQYTKNMTSTRTTTCQNKARNPNPITTIPLRESFPDVSHSDVTHQGVWHGPPASLLLIPSLSAGCGNSDDERDAVEQGLKKIEEKTQQIHESYIASLKKDMNLASNLPNNSCYLVTDSSSDYDHLESLKYRVSQFVVAAMNTRDKTQSSVLVVGVDPSTLSGNTEYIPTGLPYLKESAIQEIFEYLRHSVCVCKTNDFDFENLRAMIKMDVVSILPSSMKASPTVSVLLVTVSSSLETCRDFVFQVCIKEETGQRTKKLYRLIFDDKMGTEIVEQDTRKIRKLESIFKNIIH